MRVCVSVCLRACVPACEGDDFGYLLSAHDGAIVDDVTRFTRQQRILGKELASFVRDLTNGQT